MDASTSKTPVKVTYAKRSKRKPTTSRQNDMHSDDSSSEDERPVPKPSTRPVSRQGSARNSPIVKPTSSASTMKTPSAPSKLPRRIDPRDVPGPEPKRGRRNSDAGSESSAVKPRTRSRSRSVHTHTKSTASLNPVRPKTPARAKTPGRAKTPSGTKPLSKGARSIIADEEEDASVADSFADSLGGASVGGRINRTAKDRREYFTNQSDCYVFGPHRALCSRCKQVVNLARKQTYAVGPWERHRAKCDQELASDSPLPPNAETLVNLSVDEVFAEQPVRRNTTERRAYLLADKFIEAVEEERVKCAKCEKWVALKKGQPYDIARWKQHRDKCAPPDPPSERVLSVERKLAIINDPLVKSFDAGTIECAQCGAKAPGSVGQDYDLGAWEEHKARCRSIPAQNSGTSEGATANSVPFPTSENSPSTASTEETVVSAAADASASNRRQAMANSAKRSRDDGEDDAEPPFNRPRTEVYEPPVQESPSVLGWFMLPFHSFVRGFRESLKNERQSS